MRWMAHLLKFWIIAISWIHLFSLPGQKVLPPIAFPMSIFFSKITGSNGIKLDGNITWNHQKVCCCFCFFLYNKTFDIFHWNGLKFKLYELDNKLFNIFIPVWFVKVIFFVQYTLWFFVSMALGENWSLSLCVCVL